MRFLLRPKKSQHQNRLLVKEWGVISLFLGFLLFISVHAKFSQVADSELVKTYVPHMQRMLEIEITGSVEKPGIYSCLPGTTLKDVLEQAHVTEQANRRKIPSKKVLFSSQTIEIPEKKGLKRRDMKISLEKN